MIRLTQLALRGGLSPAPNWGSVLPQTPALCDF